MNRDEFQRFSMALTACAELYGKTVSEGAMTLWWQALERFDLAQVERAFRLAVESPDTGQFMPRPADIIKRIDGTSADRGLIAWGQVLGAMSRVGAYQSVAFDDPAIHAAIQDLGGWVKLCREESDDLPFVQRRFTDAYRAYVGRPDLPYPAILQGDHEQVNIAGGRGGNQLPVFIGDKGKAMVVARLSNNQQSVPVLALANMFRPPYD